MKKHFSYLPYAGIGDFAYIGCSPADEPAAAAVADILVSRGFRLSCDSCGGKFAQSPAALAETITHCSGAVVFLSEKSIESLAFRNAINYLLSLRKPLVCVKFGEFQLGYGLDMQLANIPVIALGSPEETAEALTKSGVLTQAMVGEGMEKRKFNRKRNYIIAAMVAVVVLVFALYVGSMIRERTSAAYILQNTNGSKYVNIAKYSDEGIAAMAGKAVGELDLSGGTFTTLLNIKEVSATTVNVSDIPSNVALWPLAQVKGIEIVKISQDQVIFARDLCNAGITVVVEH
ncbi:MAG: hypothetical protein ACOX3P_06535 [Saccharofermentanales bacterium]|jgi:hypothetical protein|nr:hypothetical protein [Bacillota bacterium]NLB08364.1 hypothetical protein [Clostridiales bacterium]